MRNEPAEYQLDKLLEAQLLEIVATIADELRQQSFANSERVDEEGKVIFEVAGVQFALLEVDIPRDFQTLKDYLVRAFFEALLDHYQDQREKMLKSPY